MPQTCAKCGTFGDENRTILYVHHVLPQTGWSGGDDDGHLVLCEHCHLDLHILLLCEVGSCAKIGMSWGNMRKHIKNFTKGWVSDASSTE
jgi:hypothetical protein